MLHEYYKGKGIPLLTSFLTWGLSSFFDRLADGCMFYSRQGLPAAPQDSVESYDLALIPGPSPSGRRGKLVKSLALRERDLG
jgi:hypothetical protein